MILLAFDDDRAGAGGYRVGGVSGRNAFHGDPLWVAGYFATTLRYAPFKIAPLYTVYRFEAMFFYDTREMLNPSC